MSLKTRQFPLFVFFLVSMSISPGLVIAATEENFLNSQLLRMIDIYDPLEVINPFLTTEKKTLGGSLNLNGEKNVYSFYKDISSKNQSLINQKLQQSFGVPYSFLGKANLYGKINLENVSLTQTFHVEMGGSFYLTDPVFPEVSTLLFQNYGASTEFNFDSPNTYKSNFSLNYGRQRALRQKLNTGDLVTSKPSFKLKERPFKSYLMVNFNIEYNLFNIGNAILKINSVPILKQDYELFNSFAGFITNNILPPDFKTIDHIKFYAGYSPFYKGNYDVKRTIVLGSKLGISSWMNFDVFSTDDMYPGGQIKLGPDFFNASLYTYQESYDNYGIYKFRNYGLNLNLNF